MIKIRIDLKTKLFYGMGVSYAIVDQIFVQWVLYFYLPPASSGLKPILTPILISMALSFSRFVDVITDPLVGYLSDKFNSKWGRRVPFIALGTIPLSLTTIAFFYPPNTGETGNFIYLLIIGSLFFTFYTVVGGPYNSLIPEIGINKEEQLSLSTWQSVFRLLYSAIAMITPGVLIKYFGKGDSLLGIREMVIFLSIISFLGSCFTIFGVKEKKYASVKKVNVNFKDAMKLLMKDINFIYYLLGLLMFFVGFNSIRATMNYYIEEIMGYTTVEITISSALLFLVSALFFYPVSKLCKKIGYRKVMLISLSLICILTIAMFFIGKNIEPKYGFVIFALLGVPVSGAAFILPPAMLSDISRRISEESGENIEGICFGIQGFFLKMAFFLSILVLPVLLSYGNNGVVGKFGIYLTTIFSTLTFILGIFFYWKYKE